MEMQMQIKKHFSQFALLYFVFTATFLCGLCAHAYRFFNLDFSHDSLMIFEDDWSVQIGLGRFGQPLYRVLRGDLGAPFLLCLLSLVWLALANCIVVSLLEIRAPRHIALLCGVLSTNAVLTFSYATYLPWVDVYTLAYLLAALAAWLTARYPFGFVAAWVPMTLSLALYQSYLNVTIILLMIVFVKNALDGFGAKELLIRIVKYLAAFLGGLVLYDIVLQIVLAVTGVPLLETYNGLSQLWSYRLDTLWELVVATWKYPLRYMLHPETYRPQATALINIAVGMAAAAALVRTALAKKMAKIPAVLLAVCVIAMPFGVNTVYFITKGYQHSLMIFSFFLLYAFALMLWEYHDRLPPARFAEKIPAAANGVKRLLPIFFGGLLSALILFNVVFANQIYLRRALEYDATVSYLTKITYSMEQTDGYVPGKTPVLFIGELHESVLYNERRGFQHLSGTGLQPVFSTTYSGTYYHFFNAVLSYRINWMDAANAGSYMELPEVQAMPVYPAKGSCRIVNGVLIVKLS